MCSVYAADHRWSSAIATHQARITRIPPMIWTGATAQDRASEEAARIPKTPIPPTAPGPTPDHPAEPQVTHSSRDRVVRVQGYQAVSSEGRFQQHYWTLSSRTSSGRYTCSSANSIGITACETLSHTSVARNIAKDSGSAPDQADMLYVQSSPAKAAGS